MPSRKAKLVARINKSVMESSVRRFEQSDGLDTVLFKNVTLPFTFNFNDYSYYSQPRQKYQVFCY